MRQQELMQRLFGTIAARYDRFNAWASLSLDRGWRHRVTTQMCAHVPAIGARILDVCTGTGDLALDCSAQLNGTSRIVGLDLSDAMLRYAQAKQAPTIGLTWLRGDAHQLPFPDQVFDGVMIGFSTRNVPDLRQACAEMWRVLRPGGQLVILEAGKPQSWWMRAVYYAYLSLLMPVIGVLVCGCWWPFQYLRRSILRFVQPRAFQALLQDVGFAEVDHRPLHRGLADMFVATKPLTAP